MILIAQSKQVLDKIFANIVACSIVVSIFWINYKPAFSISMIMFGLFIGYDYWSTHKVRKIMLNKELKYGIFSFFLLLIFSTLFNFYINDVKNIIEFFYCSLPFWMLLYLDTKHDITIGLKMGMLIVVLVLSGIASYQYHILQIDRPDVFLKSPNNLACMFGFILPMLIISLKSAFENANYQFNRQCLLYVIAIFSCGYTILLTQCRGLFIGYILSIVICTFIFLYKIKYKKIFYVGLLTGVFIVALSYFLNVQDYIYEHIARGYDYERVYALQGGLAMWKDHIWGGVGFSNWKVNYVNYYFPIGAHEHLMHAHNIYVHFLATTGIVGFIGLIIFCFEIIKTFLNRFNYFSIFNSSILLMGILAFFFQEFVDATLLIKQVTRMFWIYLAFAVIWKE